MQFKKKKETTQNNNNYYYNFVLRYVNTIKPPTTVTADNGNLRPIMF